MVKDLPQKVPEARTAIFQGIFQLKSGFFQTWAFLFLFYNGFWLKILYQTCCGRSA
jgi:hypothetical protein